MCRNKNSISRLAPSPWIVPAMRSQHFDSCWRRKGTWLDEVHLDQLLTRFVYYSASGEKERIAFTGEKRKRWMNGYALRSLMIDKRMFGRSTVCFAIQNRYGSRALRSHRLRENSHVPISNIHPHIWSSWQYIRPDHRNKRVLYTTLSNFNNLSRNLLKNSPSTY